jgi:hypothetical protein
MQDEQPDEPLLVKFFSLTWPMKNKSVSRASRTGDSCKRWKLSRPTYVQRELSPSEAGALKIVSLHLQSAGARSILRARLHRGRIERC